jgi:anthranilate synthase component 1
VLRVKAGRLWFEEGEHTQCADPLDTVQEMIAAYRPTNRRRARFEGGALGYLSYEAARYFERLPAARQDRLGLPDAVFMDVDTVLVFDHVAHTIRIVSHAWLDRPLDQAYDEAVNRIEVLAAKLRSGGQSATGAPSHQAQISPSPTVASNMQPAEFTGKVLAAKERIAAGDILQVVLAQRFSTRLAGDPFGLYRRLRTVSPSPYLYYLDFEDHQIVGASPELLLQVEGDQVTTRPIAGTRRRGRDPQEDAALAGDLLADEKERAEHLMLVDLSRNDIGRVSRPGSVNVANFMSVERFSHVMHLVTDVTGTLSAGCSSLDALRATFPAGTLSGAPKIRAMQIIADLENETRGPYAGAVGFVNTSGGMEMAITIRTGVVKEGVLHVQAGAGIVADSIPENEYAESLNKARALLLAAGVDM